MLAYRQNVPEKPRPPKPASQVEHFEPDDGLDYRPRTLRPIVSVTPSPIVPDTPRPSRPGVIAEIVEAISRDTGATVTELLVILVKKFPDRDPAGMRATAQTQATKRATHKIRDEKRGLVYYRR